MPQLVLRRERFSKFEDKGIIENLLNKVQHAPYSNRCKALKTDPNG